MIYFFSWPDILLVIILTILFGAVILIGRWFDKHEENGRNDRKSSPSS